MKRRIMSIVLTLALCLGFLPMTARAYDNPTVYVAGKEVSAGETGYEEGGSYYWAISAGNNALQEAPSANASDWNVKYTSASASETAKLTLNGGTLTAEGSTISGFKGLIAFRSGPLTIEVINNATYTETSGAAISAGILAGGDLTITGDSNLTANGGDTTESTFGILFCETGTLTIDGSGSLTVEAHSGNAASNAIGVGSTSSTVTIDVKSGTLLGVGGNGAMSAGVYTNNDGAITVRAGAALNANTDGGGVHAYGGNSTGNDSYGLCAYKGLESTGTVAFVCNSDAAYLEAYGGTASAGDHQSVGLYANTLAVSGTSDAIGLIAKGSDGALNPNDNCVRAQIVTMLYRYFVELQGQ